MSSSFTIVVFVTRRPDLSPAEFRDHWENKHIPLLQRLGGEFFPRSHTRHYLQHEETDDGSDYPIRPLVGDPGNFTYDGFAVVNFASQAAFQQFLPVMTSPDVLEDEERFTDRAKMKAVELGDVRATAWKEPI
ncbi:EthD domain-containing protein [Aspergillus aurantiobrunneus]